MKFGLALLMVVASWFVYDHRDLVLDAYRESDSDVDIRLTGIDLDVEKTPLPPSPFQIHHGRDTRRKPLELAFVDSTAAESTISMRGGTATLSGTALIGSRPAAGAVVRIERHTATGSGSIDVQTNSRGTWSAGDLPGGRYRLRSWLPGQAVDRAGTVFFIEAGESHAHSFRLEEVEDDVSVQLNNSGVMFDGLTGSVGVAVSRRQVDGEGMIVNAPVSTANVTLTVTGAAKLESGDTAKVDSSGHVTFKLRCTRIGSVSVTASVSGSGLSRQSASSPTSSSSSGSDRASGGADASRADAIRKVGRHSGCRAIPPPPPTTTTAPKNSPGTDAKGDESSPTPTTDTSQDSSSTPTTRSTTTTEENADG